jgi:hypothetical protein
MTGLYPGHKAKPTGKLIFQALAGLRLIPAPAAIPRPGPATRPSCRRPDSATMINKSPIPGGHLTHRHVRKTG